MEILKVACARCKKLVPVGELKRFPVKLVERTKSKILESGCEKCTSEEWAKVKGDK